LATSNSTPILHPLDGRDLLPPSPISAGCQQAIWLYLRFTLSYRDIEDLFAERGLDISYAWRSSALSLAKRSWIGLKSGE